MLCEYADHFQLNRLSEVLILVLMEYALRDNTTHERSLKRQSVLILVLMEYALRDSEKVATKWDKMVLILVLMEYALRESNSKIKNS